MKWIMNRTVFSLLPNPATYIWSLIIDDTCVQLGQVAMKYRMAQMTTGKSFHLVVARSSLECVGRESENNFLTYVKR